MAGTVDYCQLLESTLAKESFLMVNKKVMSIVGVEAAIVLADLLSKSKYFKDRNKDPDGWFFSDEKNRIKDTGLKRHTVRNTLKKLKHSGFIDIERHGVPPRLWFKINHATVITKIFENASLKSRIQPDINNNITNKPIEIGYKAEPEKLSSKDPIGSSFKPVNKFTRGSKPKPRPKKKVHKPNQYVEYWNRFPHTPNHHSPQTKVYQRTTFLFNQLLKGTYGQGRLFNDSWFTQQEIPMGLTRRRWTKKSILDGLDQLSNMYIDGYWPEDKSWLKKTSLADLIYNERTQKSWLLSAYINCNPPLQEQQALPELINPGLANIFLPLFGNARTISDLSNHDDRAGLISSLNSITVESAKVVTNHITHHPYYSSLLTATGGDGHKLIEDYAEWLGDTYNDFDLRPGMIKVGGKPWKRFITDWQSRLYDPEYNF